MEGKEGKEMRIKEYESGWENGKFAIDLDEIVAVTPFSEDKTRLFSSEGADFSVVAKYDDVLRDWQGLGGDPFEALTKLMRIEVTMPSDGESSGYIEFGGCSRMCFDCKEHPEALRCLETIGKAIKAQGVREGKTINCDGRKTISNRAWLENKGDYPLAEWLAEIARSMNFSNWGADPENWRIWLEKEHKEDE